MNKLKLVIEKLHRSLLLGNKTETTADSVAVPEDVKEGHFAVIAVRGDNPQRVVLPLSCLTHPTFVKLLEEAAEEYGFNHEGALAIPCSPTKLQRILAELDNRQCRHTNGTTRQTTWEESTDNGRTLVGSSIKV